MASPVLRALLVFSCAESLACASVSQPQACDGSASCVAEGAEEALSALQLGLASSLRRRAGNSTGRAQRARSSVPVLGGRNGELGDHEFGELLINEDGNWTKYYLPGAAIENGGKTVKYAPPFRYYLMKKPTTDYSKAENFYKPIFPGKTFTVDMQLTNVGCGCNLNFYLVDMPVPEAGKDHDHYCDGQCFEDMGCCAEFDMNEGNNAVQQITNHACTNDYEGHPDWACHKWGEPEVKMTPQEFAGGSGSLIDGDKPFTFSQEFRMIGEELQVITTITQGEQKVVKTMGPNAQLQAMLKTGSLEKGMAFVTGYWTAPDMNWLDGAVCGGGAESCSGAPAYISNWRITTNSPAPQPGPEPEPQPQPEGGSFKCCWGGPGSCAAEGTTAARRSIAPVLATASGPESES